MYHNETQYNIIFGIVIDIVGKTLNHAYKLLSTHMNISKYEFIKVALLVLLMINLGFTQFTNAQTTVNKQLYLSDPSQTLDRTDPVATSDATTSSTSTFSTSTSSISTGTTYTYNGAPSATSVTVSNVTVGTGVDKFMLVGISTKDKKVTSVTYGLTSLSLVDKDETSGNAKVYIYKLVNPTSGTNDITVDLDGDANKGIIIGVTNYTGVDQSNPLGSFSSAIAKNTTPTLDVTSVSGDEVFNVVSIRNSNLTACGQTQIWNLASGSEVNGGGSTKSATTALTTMSWTANASEDWAMGGVSIKPAVYITNTTFTQLPTFCSNFTIVSGQTITVSAYATINSGTMPSNPSISAELKYGSTSIITLSSPSYSSSTGIITWTGSLGSNTTIPSGEAISLVITTTESNADFTIDYDSQTKPSEIEIPTTTYISITDFDIYDQAYPNGSIITSDTAGATVYARVVVTDPFGYEDITALNLSINSGAAVSATSVATSTCTKTYEYVWVTSSTANSYSVDATAKEGYENTVTDQESLSFSTCQAIGKPVFAAGATATRSKGAGTVTYSATSTNSTGITYSLDAESLTAGLTINSSTAATTFTADWEGISTLTATATGCGGPKTQTLTVVSSYVTIDSGSYIMNLGISPQTYANGLKPYGLAYELVNHYFIPVKWFINPLKDKDGIDFSHNSIDYKGGSFVIDAGYRTTRIDSIIAVWAAKGVVGNTAVSDFQAPIYKTINYIPRWTLDLDNGDLAEVMFNNAEIPLSATREAYPSDLSTCNDLFVLPHADPTWTDHGNLYYWNADLGTYSTSSTGWIWSACHGVSAMENLSETNDYTNHGDTLLNFLTTNSLMLWDDHEDGSPAYSYAYPAEPYMQFMGTLDGATLSGSEQIYIPGSGSDWNSSTKVGVWDPTPDAADAANAGGKAAIIAFGPAFGDDTRGQVMYEAGHNLSAGTEAENTAYQRAFFNFSFLAASAKTPVVTELNVPDYMQSGQTYNVSVTANSPLTSGLTYRWVSSSDGVFGDTTAASTTFTPAPLSSTEDGLITCVVNDDCGRQGFSTTYKGTVFVPEAAAPAAVNDTSIIDFYSAVTLNVLANDSDINLDDFSFLSFDGATTIADKGTFIHNGSGSVTFTPEKYFVGTVNVDYIIKDTTDKKDTATIFIEIGFPDTDSDGIADNDDIDDDNDGIPDIDEDGGDALGDADDDGILNASDSDYAGFVDANGDGVNDNFDADGDGIINSYDLDSDNDGLSDIYEAGGTDSDNDGRVDNYVDSNGNGLSDEYDINCDGSNISGGTFAGSDKSITDPSNIYDTDIATYGSLDEQNAYIEIGFNITYPSGTVLTIKAQRVSNDAKFRVYQSVDDITYTDESGDYKALSSTADFTYTLSSDANYIRIIARDNAFRIYNIEANIQVCNSNLGTAIPNPDTDGDGVDDFLDLDSDNDGIADIVEAGGVDTDGDGKVDSSTDSDEDGFMDVYDYENGGDLITDLDTDGDGVVNRYDLDSDNDGIPDVVEAGGTDSNNDGLLDSTTDTDGDGFSDSVDGDVGNDGTAENTSGALIITGTDTDSDGEPNSYPRANADANGLPNPYDLDADGDGILDTREAGITDTDNNGIADGTLGADGWSDDVDALSSLSLTNTDGDSRPDYIDIDADNDGIVDIVEAQTTAAYIAPSGTDSDGDGIDDNYDNSDGTFGGSASNGLTPTNTDGADNPDYLDLDSDDDGKSDIIEGWDTSGNGIIDGSETLYVGTTDSDNDGLLDEYDVDDVNINPTNSSTPNSHPDVNNPSGDRDWREQQDSDNDGIADIDDIDDDNDGITDLDESGGYDPMADGDADGIPNYLDQTPGSGLPTWTDSNGDSINDYYDTDNDGIINELDLDSDNDGIYDIIEASGVDNDDNGIIDSTTDTDIDGLMDVYDANNGGTAIANPDTDNNGINDFLDLDSDNDGCSDANEAYSSSTAQGTDGNMYYGNGNPPTVDANGKVTVASYTAYSTDAIIAGSESTINTQAVDRFVQENDNTTFSVSASGGSGTTIYQWQVSSNSGSTWSDISNGGVYTGATTATLTLTTIPYSYHNYEYRVIITQSDYTCAYVVSSEKTLTINRNPVAVDDANSTNEDVTLTVTDGSADDLLMNDNDPDGNTLTITQFVVDGQTKTAGQSATITGVGTLTINANGSYTFVPVLNYNGTVPTATYTLSDGNGGTDAADLVITVNPVNDPPVAVDDANSTNEDVTLTVADGSADDLLMNDSDEEGNSLTITQFIIDGQTKTAGQSATITGVGTLTINANGSYTFVPALNYNGTVPTATYTVSDGNGGTATADLVITVIPVNDPPVAVDDENSTNMDVTLTVADNSADDLLMNDSDPEGDVLTITQFVVDGQTKTAGQSATITGVGTLTINANGSYTFVPALNYIGTVPTATYTVSDGNGGTATADLDIAVKADSDNDGIPDDIDIDDDNDGITDLDESGGVDPLADGDSDGTPNYSDQTPGGGLPSWVDTNSDGINDNYDNDLDGIINELDLDSDNDGIADIVEAGGVDTDGDGVIDSTTDSDRDGLMDLYDSNIGGDAIANRDTDGDGVPNYLDLDADNDGIPDVVEAGGTDANNDGLLDGFTDTDGDGFSDSVDGDVGNDGTAENTANALIITGTDTDSDGEPNSYPRANTDSNGLPNPYDLDADGDGILDTKEAGITDSDNNGIADGTLGADGWSDDVDVLASLGIPDSDGDGYVDYLDLDSDNDGIIDNKESQGGSYTAPSGSDSDGDGIDDSYDNNDASFGGSTDNGVTPLDSDGDGYVNHLDLDADNDGIADVIEAGGTDPDNDGIIGTGAVSDTDGDGLSNIVDSDNGGTALTIPNTDGDSYANYIDIDSDADGIVDNIEGQTSADYVAPLGIDADNNGWDDRYDGNQGGIAIVLTDTEGDGTPDYIDTDSDNDGGNDLTEAYDTDQSGTTNTSSTDNDSDGDGLDDAFDSDGVSVNNTSSSTNGGQVPTDFPNDDNSTSSELDWRELLSSLPVSLLSFDAQLKENYVELSWVTASEINNDYFDVQRSTNNVDFYKIDQVQGAGNSNVIINYTSYDYELLEGIVYYRLKQVDYDGTTDYSMTVAIRNNAENTVAIFPNPSQGVFNIETKEAIEVVIRTSMGQEIIRFSFEANTNNKVDLTNHAQGIYFLSYTTDDNVVTKKLIVR